MGILDKIKSPKRSEDKKKQKKAAVDKSAQKQPPKKEEEKTETVVRPDGSLATVKKKVSAKDKKAKAKKEDTGNAYRVLVRPLITEKASSLSALNKYVFEVTPRANKTEVRKAIKNVYGVSAQQVNIVTMAGKYVRYGRTEGSTKHWKKAIITLPQGQKIDIQEGL